MADARHAFDRASRSIVEADAALQALAVVDLQNGSGGRRSRPCSPASRVVMRRMAALQRLLAQALMANGQLQEAVQAFETARATDPKDPELAFLLGSAYLKVRKFDEAERLFAEVHQGASRSGDRRAPRAHLSRRRAVRPRARGAPARVEGRPQSTPCALLPGNDRDPRRRCPRARRSDPRVQGGAAAYRRATCLTNLRLGMALVEARRAAEALPHLEIARSCRAAAGRGLLLPGAFASRAGPCARSRRGVPPGAVACGHTARRRCPRREHPLSARARASAVGERSGGGRSFRGSPARASTRRADADREALSRFLTDTGDTSRGGVLPLDSPLASQTSEQRSALERQLKATIARASMNLGVMHAQAQRFSRAAELFAEAADADPEFPQVQYSLGVAYFNAQQYDKATGPLTRALAADPGNASIRRMLGLAWFQAGELHQGCRAARRLTRRATRIRLSSSPIATALVRTRSRRGGPADLRPPPRAARRQRGVAGPAGTGACAPGRLPRRDRIAPSRAATAAKGRRSQHDARHHLFEAGTASGSARGASDRAGDASQRRPARVRPLPRYSTSRGTRSSARSPPPSGARKAGFR